MSSSSSSAISDAIAPSEPAAVACPRCGGSGMLRLADQQYRTCLDCLGQGRLDQAQSSELTRLLQRRSGRPISLSAVSSAR